MITARRQTVGFVMNVHGDEVLAAARLPRLRHLYPKAKIAVITDGPADNGFIAACLGWKATVTVGVRLKVPEMGGAWTARWLKTGVGLGTDIIVKLDPDTGAFATAEFPDADVFGFVMHNPLRPHGSLVGVSREAAKKILKSGALLDPLYIREADRFLYRRPWDPNPRSCQDLIFGDVLDRLGIVTTSYAGIARLREERPPGMFDVPTTAAFAHPWRE